MATVVPNVTVAAKIIVMTSVAVVAVPVAVCLNVLRIVLAPVTAAVL
jgi:hypothetical protein